MTDESDLVIRILREIQATQAEHTRTLAEHTAELGSIKEMQRLHGMRLDNHTAMFSDLGEKMREVVGLLRDQATAADLRALTADLRDLQGRVGALENQRQ